MTVHQATLNGYLNDDGGEACQCGFYWGLTPAYGNITPTTSQNTGDSFSQVITGLILGQIYYFVSVATNSAGTTVNGQLSFAAVIVPVLSTNLPVVSGVTNNSAVITGVLSDTGGGDTICGFEWGTTPAYGNTTLLTPQNNSSSFTQGLSGLLPGQTYHIRAIAINGAGTTYGNDVTFTTLPNPGIGYAQPIPIGEV